MADYVHHNRCAVNAVEYYLKWNGKHNNQSFVLVILKVRLSFSIKENDTKMITCLACRYDPKKCFIAIVY